MPGALVAFRDAQEATGWPPSTCAALSASPRRSRRSPRRARAHVAGALGHDHDVGAEDVHRREQPGVDVHRLVVSAVGRPTVIVPTSQWAERSVETVREKATGSAPPSVMT